MNLGELANYLQPTPYDQLQEPRDAQGRLNTPIIPPFDNLTLDQWLSKFAELLTTMPERTARAFEQRFQWAARDAQFWYKQSALTSVAANTESMIIRYTIPERFTGRLKYIGFDAAAALSDVEWSLKINGSVHPGFSLIKFNESTLSVPLTFEQEVGPEKTIELFARNTNAAALNVVGMIGGFQKQMLDMDSVAITPSNGLG